MLYIGGDYSLRLSCQRREKFRTMMLQGLMWLLCRQAIMNGLNGTMRMNTEYGLDQSLMTNTDSPPG